LVRIWAPVVLLIGIVAVESQTFFGSDHTTRPLRAVCEYFLGPTTAHQWWEIHLFIRKSCHVVGFGLLSAGIFRAAWLSASRRLANESGRAWMEWTTWRGWRLRCHLLAILGTVMVAAADEIHQTFLPNRTGCVEDVLVDTLGAAVAQLLIWTVMTSRGLASTGSTRPA